MPEKKELKTEKQQITEVTASLLIEPLTKMMFYIPSAQIEVLEVKMAEVIRKHNRLVSLITEQVV